MQNHPNVVAVQDALDAAGATAGDGQPAQVIVLDEAAHTAAAAAEALCIKVGQIANSLIFDADGEPLLVLTSGAHRVDTAKVAAALGIGKLKGATPEFVRTHTGQAIGGVAPLGPSGGRGSRTHLAIVSSLDPTMGRRREGSATLSRAVPS
ncbi:YbaK/EbsC family protein [Micromonospora carbonacea]|uniref:Aminoacyl-tRNA editing domain-containing protein n=1 Tax=Micromonospora carbonacea TaxID=47853 RepID=A0A1C4YF55_9ACTN|nr:YbaK/EbsC family protein [Micromonospora carbonacea]SCF19355.1 Aminoacyl-tRNA editing domain-containing protein [Micromonospora carbonacea]